MLIVITSLLNIDAYSGAAESKLVGVILSA